MTTNAIAWGMNWVKADTPLIPFSNVSSGNRQKKLDNTPTARTDVAGKRCCGCSRANKEKNCPSAAPAYSTREKPSNEVNRLPNVATKINIVNTTAASCPCRRAMKSETTNVDWAASRHGITPITVTVVKE